MARPTRTQLQLATFALSLAIVGATAAAALAFRPWKPAPPAVASHDAPTPVTSAAGHAAAGHDAAAAPGREVATAPAPSPAPNAPTPTDEAVTLPVLGGSPPAPSPAPNAPTPTDEAVTLPVLGGSPPAPPAPPTPTGPATLPVLTGSAPRPAGDQAAPAEVAPAVAEAPATLSGPAAPLAASTELTRIAFGSCADQTRDLGIFSTVAADRPQLYIALGDNVYADKRPDGGWVARDADPATRLSVMREAYAALGRSPHWQALLATAPVLPVWDDHDYGVNDGGADFPLKAESQQIFAEFFELPATDPRRTRPGIYNAWTYGPEGRRVQIIALDLRSFRDPFLRNPERDAVDARIRAARSPEEAQRLRDEGRAVPVYLPDRTPEGEGRTLLGEAQWAWLRERLAEPADLRILVSSIQVLAEGHGWERWGMLPAERRRLLTALAEAEGGATVILSGDRHISGIYLADRAAYPTLPRPIWEVTASSLNRTFVTQETDPALAPHQTVVGLPASLSSLDGGARTFGFYGLLDIDWTGRSVELRIKDDQGRIVRAASLPFATIGVPTE